MITANLLVLICWFRHYVLHDSSSLDEDSAPDAQPGEMLGQDIHITPATTSNPSLRLATLGPMDTLSSSREGQWDKNNIEALHQTQETEISW